MDHLTVCYLCLVCVMLSPAGRELTSWLSFVMLYCVFVTFPCGILGHVWYLIVWIPDLPHLSYLPISNDNVIVSTKIYDKRDDFDFEFVKFPILVVFIALHPMAFTSLNSYDLLEHLAMLLT